jgi:RimJ/RimL family protein N-acetyltransferase
MITLRPLELADAPAVFEAVNHSRDALRRWMVWYSEAYSVTHAEAWIEQTLVARAGGTGFHFAICDANGVLVGVIGLEDVNAVTGRAMIGYWVATPFTGDRKARCWRRARLGRESGANRNRVGTRC